MRHEHRGDCATDVSRCENEFGREKRKKRKEKREKRKITQRRRDRRVSAEKKKHIPRYARNDNFTSVSRLNSRTNGMRNGKRNW